MGKHGIPKDPEQSLKWIQRSAEHGNSQAQFHLASNYLYGQDVPKDMSEAVRWFRRAAVQGHAEAQNSIGYACETGATGDTNVVEAYMWYQLAVGQGEARSQVNLKRLWPRLAPEQISEGNRRLQEFTPRPAELLTHFQRKQLLTLPIKPARSAVGATRAGATRLPK